MILAPVTFLRQRFYKPNTLIATLVLAHLQMNNQLPPAFLLYGYMINCQLQEVVERKFGADGPS